MWILQTIAEYVIHSIKVVHSILCCLQRWMLHVYSECSEVGGEGVYIGARALLDISLIWFGYIARLSQWGGGGHILLVQMISTCLICASRKGRGASTLWLLGEQQQVWVWWWVYRCNVGCIRVVSHFWHNETSSLPSPPPWHGPFSATF
jgi:hypothetical protein